MAVNALDPELSFLASRAAVELDQILRGVSSEVSAVKQLAEKMKASVEMAPASSVRFLNANTATVTVLGRAINSYRSESDAIPITTIDALTAKTEEIADQLSHMDRLAGNAGAAENAAELRWATAFCLALSRYAAAYRKSSLPTKRPHPFRR